jgi:hypothetical protein
LGKVTKIMYFGEIEEVMKKRKRKKKLQNLYR